jgi:hypothetical protein
MAPFYCKKFVKKAKVELLIWAFKPFSKENYRKRLQKNKADRVSFL